MSLGYQRVRDLHMPMMLIATSVKDWIGLAYELGLPQYQVEFLKNEYGGIQNIMSKVIENWIMYDKHASLDKLANAKSSLYGVYILIFIIDTVLEVC